MLGRFFIRSYGSGSIDARNVRRNVGSRITLAVRGFDEHTYRAVPRGTWSLGR